MKQLEASAGMSIATVNFEEAVTAYGSVQAVEGSEHLLLQPSHYIFGKGTSLWDLLYQPDGVPPQPFFGAEAQIILHALETVASGETPSAHAERAGIMLGKLAPVPKPSVALVAAKQPEVTASVEAKPPAAKPSRIRQLMGRQILLKSFGEIQTARQSVRVFADEDHRLLQLGNGRPSLASVIEEVDPFQPPSEAWSFRGRDARVIRRTLQQAATRNTSIYDRSAAHMLQARGLLSSPNRHGADKAPPRVPPLAHQLTLRIRTN